MEEREGLLTAGGGERERQERGRQELRRTERERQEQELRGVRETVDGTPCAGVRETGSDGGIASPVAEELAEGERVSAKEREGDCRRESEGLIDAGGRRTRRRREGERRRRERVIGGREREGLIERKNSF
jgi:hypothetical protein